MSKVKVMTDSVACFPKDLAQQYEIKIIPAANIIIGDKTYIDGVTLQPSEAYELIKKDPDKFTTSALTPGYILGEMLELSKKTDQIIHMPLSAALSAGFKSSHLAAETLIKDSPQTKVKIFDTKSVGGLQGLVVLQAAKAAAKGMNLDQVYDVAQKTREKTHGIMMLDTLRYIYRTGRMSKIGSRIAALFQIKPINVITDTGTIEFVDRVREREKGYQRIVEYIQEEEKTDAFHFWITHASMPGMADDLIALFKQNFKCLSVIISEYSPVMGYGGGPGAICLGWHPELNLV
jgi:DegV family protein with EDD domain